jgi:hypothetical protein
MGRVNGYGGRGSGKSETMRGLWAMTTFKAAMREAYFAGARDEMPDDVSFETFFAEHVRRATGPETRADVKPGAVFPQIVGRGVRVENYKTQAEFVELNYADVERQIYAAFGVPAELLGGDYTPGVVGVRTGRFSASNPPHMSDSQKQAIADAFPTAPAEIGGKLASGPTDEELKAWYDNGRDLQHPRDLPGLVDHLDASDPETLKDRVLHRDVVVVATTDKDQDGNAVEREIPRSEWEDAPIVDATPDTESPNGSD